MPECTDPQMRTLIHSYEYDQLPDSDRKLFEEHLLSCTFCLGEAQSMHRLSTAMIANREGVLDVLRVDGLTFDRVRRHLTTPRETLGSRLSTLLRGWPGRAALAGAAAMAILFGFLLRTPPADNPFLTDLSYELPPYANGIHLRGGPEDDASKLFASAMEFYVQDDYGAAASGIKHSLKLDSSQPDRWLYLGAAQYAMRDARSAIKSLKQAERRGEGLTKTRAQWYLAQCFLFQGKVSRARVLLESVTAQNGEHADEAKALLARISEHERQRQ